MSQQVVGLVMDLGPVWEEQECLMVPLGPEYALEQLMEQLVRSQEPEVQGFDELHLWELMEMRVWEPEQPVVVQILWEWLHAALQAGL